MMKSKYIAPSSLVIMLDTMHVIAESLTINRNGSSITSSNDILVKENAAVNDNSIWNEEW